MKMACLPRRLERQTCACRLEDRTNAKAIWKPDDPAVLRQEVEERKQQQRDAARKKKENLLKTKVSPPPPLPLHDIDVVGTSLVLCLAVVEWSGLSVVSGRSSVALSQAKDLEKFQGLAQLPSIPDALADKYSKFGEDGYPTADKDGNPLDGKALEKAKKDVEKAAKIRAPLGKKLDEDPKFLESLAAEVEAMTRELAAM